MFQSRHQSYSSEGDYRRPRVREAGRREQLSCGNPLWGSRLPHVFMSGLSLSYYKTPTFSGLTVYNLTFSSEIFFFNGAGGMVGELGPSGCLLIITFYPSV